jgi:hypothetical protein
MPLPQHHLNMVLLAIIQQGYQAGPIHHRAIHRYTGHVI